MFKWFKCLNGGMITKILRIKDYIKKLELKQCSKCRQYFAYIDVSLKLKSKHVCHHSFSL